MKKILFLTTLFLGLSLSCSAQFFGKTKTINVIPDKAKIIVGGAEIGQGTADITITRQDFML